MRDHTTLLAWQRANAVVKQVFRACHDHWKPPAAALFSQLQRASLSVQLNIAEGHALNNKRQFRYHLNVAYGSAVEVAELLTLCLETKIIPAEAAKLTLANCRESQALIMGLMKKHL